jgi:predicted transposase/invertase (TIGR01784 family)
MLERTIERLRQKARAEGIEAGRAEGIEEGEAKGEATAKARVAKKLLAEGRSPAEVAEIVELPEDQVRRLLH